MIPIKHDFYIICYPYQGHKDDYRCVVEEFEHGQFDNDFLERKYGKYKKWGPYEQESWAVKGAFKVEDRILELQGHEPHFSRRPE